MQRKESPSRGPLKARYFTMQSLGEGQNKEKRGGGGNPKKSVRACAYEKERKGTHRKRKRETGYRPLVLLAQTEPDAHTRKRSGGGSGRRQRGGGTRASMQRHFPSSSSSLAFDDPLPPVLPTRYLAVGMHGWEFAHQYIELCVLKKGWFIYVFNSLL